MVRRACEIHVFRRNSAKFYRMEHKCLKTLKGVEGRRDGDR
jgi:hypothetical protein